MKKSLLLILALPFILITTSFKAPENQTRVIINKLLAATAAHKGSTYTMRGSERLVGKSGLRVADIYTKVNVAPAKVYLKMMTDPNKGTELLYVKGERNDKVLVNAGKMIPTVTLSPFSGLVTKEQHHTILSSGFSIVNRIISEGVKKADAASKFDSVFRYVGDVTWNNRACYKVIIEDPTYGYTNYKAQKGETMYSIALKFLVPEYSMVENSGVKNFEEDLGGKTLKIPTSYARKTVLYIDKQNYFPVFQEMTDDKGVFERYEFFNLVVNPTFKSDEFTKDFSEYGF